MAVSSATLQQVLEETRTRFVSTFPSQCDSIRVLVDGVATAGTAGPVAELTHAVHRMTGLAGTIGFPTVSARAADLEVLVDRAGSKEFASPARDAVEAIQQAFVTDLALPPVSVEPPAAAPAGLTILVAEDEADQRAIVTTCLRDAGYVPVTVTTGDLVTYTARAEKPAVILLDIALPGVDGYTACRRLKADPELADIPVIFMTTGANLDDKLTGLALGADEFLSKPLDMRELLLRIKRLINRGGTNRPAAAAEPCGPAELTYAAFLDVATREIARLPVALAIVRLPADARDEGSRLLIEEIRGRDAIGSHGPTHLLLLMPEITAAAARDRLDVVLERLLARDLRGVCAGITESAEAAGKTVDILIAEADEALAAARYLGSCTAIWAERPERTAPVVATRVVLVAEDDPDVTRIVDAHVRAAGYRTIIAFDGEQALAAVREHSPHALVLDLMLPKLTGFDILTQLRGWPVPRPRVIVLSGRGREEDVLRAFELGADDYMTKPFNPQELMVRIARLLK